MDMELKKWLIEALEHSGYSQAALARALETKLQRSFPQVKLYKILKGLRKINIDEFIAIEDITNYAFLRKKTISLLGFVGAGAEIIAYDQGYSEEIDISPNFYEGTCALKVQSDSMEPFIESGTILYYSKHLPPNYMLNKKAIVQLLDGRCFIKIIRMGSAEKTFTLESINRLYPDIKDVELMWAAPIDWLKPPSLH